MKSNEMRADWMKNNMEKKKTSYLDHLDQYNLNVFGMFKGN